VYFYRDIVGEITEKIIKLILPMLGIMFTIGFWAYGMIYYFYFSVAFEC